MVVDGRVGYTGGFGLDDKWFGDGRTRGEWRDSTARFTGQAVLQLQATFAAGWAEATGDLLAGDLFFPEETAREQAGDVRAAVMHCAPTIGSGIPANALHQEGHGLGEAIPLSLCPDARLSLRLKRCVELFGRHFSPPLEWRDAEASTKREGVQSQDVSVPS